MIRRAESTYRHHYTQISRGMKKEILLKIQIFFSWKNERNQTNIYTHTERKDAPNLEQRERKKIQQKLNERKNKRKNSYYTHIHRWNI